MKASLHMGAKGAGIALAHNDGCMYRADTEKFETSRAKNVHYDMYNGRLTGDAKRGATVAAVKRFYEETLRDEYGATLDSDGWKRNPGRVVDFETWCSQRDRALTECIVGLGNVDEHAPREAFEAGLQAAREAFESAGLTVVAIDEHYDEATDHAHLILAADKYGKKLNVEKTLEGHGIEPPNLPRRQVKDRKTKKMRLETDREYNKRNTRIATVTAAARKAAEDAIDAYFIARDMAPLDRERTESRDHESLAEYKARHAREREHRVAAETAQRDAEKYTAEAVKAKQEADRAKRTRDAYAGEEFTAVRSDGSRTKELGVKGLKREVARLRDEFKDSKTELEATRTELKSAKDDLAITQKLEDDAHNEWRTLSKKKRDLEVDILHAEATLKITNDELADAAQGVAAYRAIDAHNEWRTLSKKKRDLEVDILHAEATLKITNDELADAAQGVAAYRAIVDRYGDPDELENAIDEMKYATVNPAPVVIDGVERNGTDYVREVFLQSAEFFSRRADSMRNRSPEAAERAKGDDALAKAMLQAAEDPAAESIAARVTKGSRRADSMRNRSPEAAERAKGDDALAKAMLQAAEDPAAESIAARVTKGNPHTLHDRIEALKTRLKSAVNAVRNMRFSAAMEQAIAEVHAADAMRTPSSSRSRRIEALKTRLKSAVNAVRNMRFSAAMEQAIAEVHAADAMRTPSSSRSRERDYPSY